MQAVINGQVVEVEERLLCLPCDQEYHDTLKNHIPPWLRPSSLGPDQALVVDHATGMYRPATFSEVQEYAFGGELDLIQPMDDDD